MKVITFSLKFPKGHPREGEFTYFVPKIWDGRKKHTIRAGHRWKVGDTFSPRHWMGKPYASKQSQFSEPITIKKIWDFDIDPLTGNYLLNGRELRYHEVKAVAENDGLECSDFECWFPKEFRGQIICWDETVEY